MTSAAQFAILVAAIAASAGCALAPPSSSPESRAALLPNSNLEPLIFHGNSTLDAVALSAGDGTCIGASGHDRTGFVAPFAGHAHVVATWTPENPTLSQLSLALLSDTPGAPKNVGPSPLELDVPHVAAGRYEISVSCPPGVTLTEPDPQVAAWTVTLWR
jgi:hypothetical protein